MKMFKILQANRLAALVMLAAFFVGACSSNPIVPTAPGTTGNTSISNFQPTTDIPIPAGARFNAERSLVLSGKDYWTGRLVLDVKPNISEVFAFYQQEMPPLGWEAVASVLSTTSVLTFMRQNRTATVQIVPQRWGGTQIAVTVATRRPNGLRGVAPGLGNSPLPSISQQSQQVFPSPPPPQAYNQTRQQQPSQTGPLFQQQIPSVYPSR